MRTMNVNCPVCQQTHPDLHLQLLDWKTATYKCPIIGQQVNLLGFIPGAKTMVMSPGTKEDSHVDTLVNVVISDTVPYNESKAVTGFTSQGAIKNHVDDLKEIIYIGPNGEFTNELPTNVNGSFTMTWTISMVNTSYTITPSGSGRMPMAANHKIYLDTDKYIEIEVEPTHIALKYWVPSSTAGSPIVAAHNTYSGTWTPDLDYIFKLDVEGNLLKLYVWESGAQKPPMTITVNSGTTVDLTPKKSVFTYPCASPGGTVTTPIYTGTYPLATYEPYLLKVKYPAMLMHNITADPSIVTPITPAIT